MALPLASVAVADASTAPAQAALGSLPGLHLLLRVLPLRGKASHTTKQHQNALKLPVPSELGELQRHPLWRYGSTAAQWPSPRHISNAPLAPAEAEKALLAYVHLAAQSEEQAQAGQPSRKALSTMDVASELHALYTLAAIHVAQQREDQGSLHQQHKQSLSDADFLQLLKSYASIDDRLQPALSGTVSTQPDVPGGTKPWDTNVQAAAAAAAVEAIYAFARLADAPQNCSMQLGSNAGSQLQEHHHMQQGHSNRPGRLQSFPADEGHTLQAYKQLAMSSQPSDSMQSSNGHSSSSRTGNDLQVLLELARMGLHTAPCGHPQA